MKFQGLMLAILGMLTFSCAQTYDVARCMKFVAVLTS
jgi:hypothetical protein